MIIVWKRFTAEIQGKREIEQTCEKCRTKFYYTLVRHAVGQADAVYYLFQRRAQRRAQENAESALESALEEDRDLVACPKCSWINEDSIALIRKSHYVSLGHASLLLLGVGLCATLITGMVQMDHDEELALFVFAIGSIISIGIAVCGFVLRRTLRRRIDPNNTYPQPPVLPDGSPRAYLRSATGEAIAPPDSDRTFKFIKQADSRSSDPPELNIGNRWKNGWALIQAGINPLPAYCCECLGPAEREFRVPFSANAQSVIAVPMCRTCYRVTRLRWWRIFLVVMATAVAACAALILLPEKPIKFAPIVVGIVLVTLFSLAVVPTELVKPYRAKVVDAGRGLFRVRFRNEAYTRLAAGQTKVK